jgi:hypothetical protein
MLATSTSVVLAPPFFNFATSLLHDAKNRRHFSRRHPVILRHLYVRLKPDFDLAIRGIDVDVHAILFEREKVEAIPTLSKYGRAQAFDRSTASGCSCRRSERKRRRTAIHHFPLAWQLLTQLAPVAAATY